MTSIKVRNRSWNFAAVSIPTISSCERPENAAMLEARWNTERNRTVTEYAATRAQSPRLRMKMGELASSLTFMRKIPI
jgi:hypothetical protein